MLPLLKRDIMRTSSYRSYIAVYHEAVTVNMLEIIMFHRTAVESADEYLRRDARHTGGVPEPTDPEVGPAVQDVAAARVLRRGVGSVARGAAACSSP